MQTLQITVSSSAGIKQLKKYLQGLEYVSSIRVVTGDDNNTVNEPTVPYNWVNPQRAATDDEIDELIKTMELEESSGVFMDSNQVQQRSFKKIEEWEKSNN